MIESVRTLAPRELEYTMTSRMYECIRECAPKNVNAKEWVLKYVNDTFGLLGTVTEIHLED